METALTAASKDEAIVMTELMMDGHHKPRGTSKLSDKHP